MAGLVPAIHAFHALGLGSWVPGTRACPGPDPGPGKTSQRDLPPMSFPDITAELKASMPELRGRLLANQALKDLTWFRVGGPAQILFMPEDEADLAYLLERLPSGVPVSAVGLGSNLIRRDRRGAAHERGRLWARDQGCAPRGARNRPAGSGPGLRQCRHGLCQ